MTTGGILWFIGVISLIAYVLQLTAREPKQTRVALGTYWLLFIVIPLVIFGAVLGFSTLAFALGLLVLLVLTLVGERGLRWWSRLFDAP